jgi:hypothetical protein
MRNDDPNAKAVAFVGSLGVLIVIMVVVLLQAFFYRAEQQENERKALVASPGELRALQAQQRDQLATYRIVDREKGLVAIPIQEAMRLTRLELAAAQHDASSAR